MNWRRVIRFPSESVKRMNNRDNEPEKNISKIGIVNKNIQILDSGVVKLGESKTTNRRTRQTLYAIRHVALTATGILGNAIFLASSFDLINKRLKSAILINSPATTPEIIASEEKKLRLGIDKWDANIFIKTKPEMEAIERVIAKSILEGNNLRRSGSD